MAVSRSLRYRVYVSDGPLGSHLAPMDAKAARDELLLLAQIGYRVLYDKAAAAELLRQFGDSAPDTDVGPMDAVDRRPSSASEGAPVPVGTDQENERVDSDDQATSQALPDERSDPVDVKRGPGWMARVKPPQQQER